MRVLDDLQAAPPHPHRLEGLINDEYEIECPECTAVMFVAFGDDGPASCFGGYTTDLDVPEPPLRPADPEAMSGLADRLHTTARAYGHEDVAVRLTHLFGTVTCPDRSAEFTVADQVHPY